ncbi:MAG: hypothetical protein ACI4RU_02305 [Acutalibacteraceae bacterium]
MNRYKRIALVFLAVLMSVGLYACKNTGASDKEPQTDYMICEGLYLKGKSDHLIVIENEGPVVMHDNTQSDGKIFEGLLDGDKIRISCDMILETYPGSTGIYHLEVIENGSLNDIDKDTYNQLVEMGWVEK